MRKSTGRLPAGQTRSEAVLWGPIISLAGMLHVTRPNSGIARGEPYRWGCGASRLLATVQRPLRPGMARRHGCRGLVSCAGCSVSWVILGMSHARREQVEFMNAVRLALYYGLARHLPSAAAPLGPLWRWIRVRTVGPCLRRCDVSANIEHGVYFGRGAKVELGRCSGLGIDCRLHGEAIVGDNVMMGPECVLIAQAHGPAARSLTSPMRHVESAWEQRLAWYPGGRSCRGDDRG